MTPSPIERTDPPIAAPPGGALPWLAASLVVVAAGAWAILVRPLAPDLGPTPDPATWFDAELLATIAAYRGPLRTVVIVGIVIDVVVPLLVVRTPAGRRLTSRVVDAVGRSRPVRAASAVVVVVIFATSVVQLPLAVWQHLHAREFGLSTQSLWGWAGDWLIAVGVTLCAAGVLGAAGYALLRRWPRHWVIIAVPAALPVIAAATFLSPLIIEPLRYDVTPLPEGATRRALTAVLDADGRGDATLLVADASRRTTRQNAYVSGLAGTRRIVLFDTLLERPPEQVALIVAHELAHERNMDLLRSVFAGAAGLVFVCVAIDLVLRRRVRHARQRTIGDPHGAGVVVAVVMVVLTLTAPVEALISRRAEAAADLGALQLSGAVDDYCLAQRGLVERNLSDPAPPAWERVWWWSHPPAASRLQMASEFADAEQVC